MSTPVIDYPNSLGRVVRMTRSEFCFRLIGRLEGLRDLYTGQEFAAMKLDLMNRAEARFDQLLLKPEYQEEE
jgi:hypothetical protein